MAKERDREKERKRDRKGETLNHLSIHQWVRSAIFAPQQLTSPIGFSFLKLPPPPCAVRLVFNVHPLHAVSHHLLDLFSTKNPWNIYQLCLRHLHPNVHLRFWRQICIFKSLQHLDGAGIVTLQEDK